jgi:hypothetical protein
LAQKTKEKKKKKKKQTRRERSYTPVVCHKNQREQQGVYIAQEKCNCNRRKTKEKSQKCS